jgi:hypothetical protein
LRAALVDEAIGPNPDGWSADHPAAFGRAAWVAESIARTTIAEIRSALAELDAERIAETKGLVGLVKRAWEKVGKVFRRAEHVRAPLIGETEASEAVHLGSLLAAAEIDRSRSLGGKTRVVKRWLVDGNPCERCISNAAAGAVPLGSAFPSGAGYPPDHPHCMCSVVYSDVR